jgi:hypothetical protein
MRFCTLAQIHLTRWLVMLVGQAIKSKSCPIVSD